MDETSGVSADQDVCETFCASEDAQKLKETLVNVAGLSEVFKVLSDETRTAIIYLLSQQELCVCDLASILGMSSPAIAHHLRLLRAFRLVKYRRSGKMAYYSLDDSHILNLIHEAQSHFAEDR